jgi:hypothetical protein
MTLPRLCLPLALLGVGFVATPASAAGPVPLLASRTVQDIAVAGPDVIVTRAGPLGTARVDSLPTGGGPTRELLRTAPRGEEWEALTAVAASPQRVAVVAAFVSADGEFTAQLYTGPPGGPLTLMPRSGAAPIDVAVDGDRVLVVEVVREIARLRLLTPGAAPRIVPLSSPLTGFFAFAGERVAFNSDERLVLQNLAGARLQSARADEFANLDVAADGTIVADGDDVGVFTVKPSGLRQGVPDGEFLTRPRFAGSAIAAVEEARFEAGRPVVLDAGAFHPRPIGLPSSEIPEVDADARGVAWIANGCVLYATVDAVAPAEPPVGPCARAEVEVEDASFTLRGRRLRLIAECIAAPAAGCTGSVTVRGRGIRGRGAFHAEPGRARRFTVRFTRRSARRIRREVRRDEGSFLDMTTRLEDGGPPDRDGGVFIATVR